MKNIVRILSAFAAAALMATAAAAYSPGATPLLTKTAEPIPVIADGMDALPVTSSVGSQGGDTAVLFDSDTETGIDVVFDEETRTYTLRIATGLPTTLSAVALVTASENEDVVTCRIYGTNDSTEQAWTPIALSSPVVETGEWHILNVAEPEDGWETAEKYAFYKIEITMDEGEGFTFSECLLIRPALDEPIRYYGDAEVVEEGFTPPILVKETAAPALPRSLRLGIFFPGIMK